VLHKEETAPMPKLDLEAIPQTNATGYPEPYNQQVAGRWYRRLGPVAGLTQMGASHVVLRPGAWSSQRHFHYGEDEMLVMLTGEAVLVEDPEGPNKGRTVLGPGDICMWRKDLQMGHHLINESDADCSFLAISAGSNTGGWYPDIDMRWAEDNKYYRKGSGMFDTRPPL
jgi:uncharacterized cupin superfamily protein